MSVRIGVLASICLLTIFRLLVAAHAPLVPDEAYYWLWSRVPSSGYYDHPPMIAWWIWASTSILGDTPLAVRVLPVLSVAVASIALIGTARELFPQNKELAASAALLINATFLIGTGAFFSTPDAPSVMFWSLATWSLAALRRTGDLRLWLVVGLLAGLGCLSKYTNLFLGPGIVLWLLIDPKERRWVGTPWPWIGGVIALVVFLPVLAWNAEHHWVSLAKQFGRIGHGGVTWRFLGEFLLAQFLLLNPAIAVLAATGLRHYRTAAPDSPLKANGCLIALSSPLLIYMLVHSIHDRVQGNWLAPAYPALALLAAIGGRNDRFSISTRSSVFAGIALSLAAQAIAVLPGGPAFPFKSQADLMIGWQDLANAVEADRRRSGADWIATTDYGLTGELAFYGRRDDRVREIIERERYSFEPPDGDLATRPALLILGDGSSIEQFRHCFATAVPVGSVPRMAGGRTINTYQIFKVTGGRADLLSLGCKW